MVVSYHEATENPTQVFRKSSKDEGQGHLDSQLPDPLTVRDFAASVMEGNSSSAELSQRLEIKESNSQPIKKLNSKKKKKCIPYDPFIASA